MNKRIFGIKISTILTAVVCLVVSTAIWMLVKYQAGADAAASVLRVLSLFRG